MSKQNKLLIGRSEWCQLPELKIPAIKAKIDTGALTSSLHAFNIETIEKDNQKIVRFDINPLQANNDIELRCQSPVIDERAVMSSNGHKELRYIIETLLILGDKAWNIEISLSNRDPLKFRMLLGREALQNRVLIDPSITCNLSKLKTKSVLQKYQKIHKELK